MSALSKVLKVKILLTVFLWCLPLLLCPACLLKWLGFPAPEQQVFLRLLGMAYAALVVGYVFGLRASIRGDYPVGIVWVGIVSNGGAFVLLAISAALGEWETGAWPAQFAMWVSIIGTGGITAGLLAFGPCRSRVG